MQFEGKNQPKKQEPKFRYQCYGCTNDVGEFVENKVGISVTCPTCGMTQNTKEENYILL